MGIFRDLFDSSTAETKVNDSLSSSLAGAAFGLLFTACYYFGGAYFSLTADESTPSFGWDITPSMNPGMETLVGASDVTVDVSGEEVAGFTYLTPVAATVSAGVSETTGDISEDSSSGGEEIIAVIFHRDAMPYSRVEKRAEKIFAQLHKEEKRQEQFPTIIAQNQETYDAFMPLYGKSIKNFKENLEIMEAVLKDGSIN